MGKTAQRVKGSRLTKFARQPGRKVLLAEFVVCMAVVGLSAIGIEDKSKAPSHMARRATGLCVLFFVLAVVAGTSARARPGRRAAANGLGALVTLGFLMSEHQAISNLGAFFAKAKASGDKASGQASG